MENVHDLKSRVSVDIDFEADGKQHGHACVALSVDESAWGQIQMPITVIKNGEGPTVLFTGGNHGDEYEGPVAQFKLANKLEAKDIQGRVIIFPCMNMPAVMGGKRTSPIDGGNMNRVFPGHPKGTMTEQIAHFVSTELVSRAEVVVDMHSGGKTLDFIPSAVIHNIPNKQTMTKALAALKDFGAPVSMVLDEDTTGMLDGEVESRNKVFISTELGGMGTVIAERVKIAENAIHNVLVHFGLITGEVITLESQGLPPTEFLDTPSENFVRSKHQGIYEPLVDLGGRVKKGQPIGQIWQYYNAGCAPEVYHAPTDGTIYARHVPGLISHGDAMALVAVDFEVPKL